MRQALRSLQEITRRGDVHILNFVGCELARGGERADPCLFFLVESQDPAALPHLIRHYEKTKDATILSYIGRQGSPAACGFLEGVVRNETNRERREFAFVALGNLYAALDRVGNADGCARVRDTIFQLYDEVPVATARAQFEPRVLGVIPHPGAVARLEQTLAEVKKNAPGIQGGVEEALERCRRQVERVTGIKYPGGP
jgi:hypothetical protein